MDLSTEPSAGLPAIDADYEMMGSDTAQHLQTEYRMDEYPIAVEEAGDVILAEELDCADVYADVEFKDEEAGLAQPEHTMPEEAITKLSEESVMAAPAAAETFPQADAAPPSDVALAMATEASPAAPAASAATVTTTTETPTVAGTSSEGTNAAKTSVSGAHDAAVENHSEVDELADASVSRLHPREENVRNDQADDTADDGDESRDSDDSTSPPTVRVSFNGQDFVLFSSEEPTAYLGAASDATDEATDDSPAPRIKVTAPGLKITPEVFWQPLESLFSALRVKDALGEFLEDGTELVLHMPDLDLTVQEDNVYCRDITLDDLFQLHQGCGLTTSLHVLVTETQRFISNYNTLAQHIADFITEADEEQADGDVDAAALQGLEGDEEADAHEEDELEGGDADARESAQAVQEIVSEANAVKEDASHEAFESTEVDAGEADAHPYEHASEEGQAQEGPQAEEMGDIAEEDDALEQQDKPQGATGDDEDRDHGAEEEDEEEADQTYVTVNDGGEEDEIEAGDAEEYGEGEEQEAVYEDDGADAGQDFDAEAEAEMDDYALAEVDAEDGEEAYYEDGEDDSVTLEGSESTEDAAVAPEADDGAQVSAEEEQYGEGEEDEIVEYEDHEGLNGDFTIAATSETDSKTYGDYAPPSAAKAKRPLDEAEEQAHQLEVANGEPKRARVEQDV